MTNGEYLRTMSNEELAKIILSCNYCVLDEQLCDCNCTQHIKEWLEQERKESDRK